MCRRIERPAVDTGEVAGAQSDLLLCVKLEKTKNEGNGKCGDEFHQIVAFVFGRQIRLVSDGVIEANNSKNELLGFELFKTILESRKNQSSKEMLHHIREHVNNFTKGHEQHDDMTIVVIRYH